MNPEKHISEWCCFHSCPLQECIKWDENSPCAMRGYDKSFMAFHLNHRIDNASIKANTSRYLCGVQNKGANGDGMSALGYHISSRIGDNKFTFTKNFFFEPEHPTPQGLAFVRRIKREAEQQNIEDAHLSVGDIFTESNGDLIDCIRQNHRAAGYIRPAMARDAYRELKRRYMNIPVGHDSDDCVDCGTYGECLDAMKLIQTALKELYGNNTSSSEASGMNPSVCVVPSTATPNSLSGIDSPLCQMPAKSEDKKYYCHERNCRGHPIG